MVYGIGQQLDDASKLSIKELVQLQSMDPSLIYTLALQEKQKLQAAASNQEALRMQTPESTITKQMEGRMPGVQMAAARTTPRPQMAQAQPRPMVQAQPRPMAQAQPRPMAQAQPQTRGIAAVPAPNMQALGRAQGGIISYAQGGTTKVDEKPSPAYLDPEVATFLKELAALNKQKANAFPQEKDLFQQKINDLMSITSPRVKRLASESQFGLPKENGMNKGGEVKKFQSGDFVGIEGEERPLTLDGDEYAFNGEPISAEEYARIARLINSEGIPVNRGKSQLQRLIETLNAVGESDMGAKPVRDFLFDSANKGAKGLSNLINYTPSSTEGVAEGLAQMLPKNVNELADILAGTNRAERKKERLNAANMEALRVAEEKSAPKTLAEILMDAQKQFDANPTAIVSENKDGDGDGDELPPKETGIRSVVSKTRPFLDKAMGIAEILGRGAGSSKGFEGAKIVEESRKIREAEADRANRLEEQRMLLEGRKAELDARNAAAMNMSAAEYQAELTDETIRMSDEYRRIEEEKLRAAGQGIFASPFNALTDEDEAKIASEMQDVIKAIRARKLQEFRSVLDQSSGVSGQAGINTMPTPTNFADYNPTT